VECEVNGYTLYNLVGGKYTEKVFTSYFYMNTDRGIMASKSAWMEEVNARTISRLNDSGGH
jgi:hypothetical protein